MEGQKTNLSYYIIMLIKFPWGIHPKCLMESIVARWLLYSQRMTLNSFDFRFRSTVFIAADRHQGRLKFFPPFRHKVIYDDIWYNFADYSFEQTISSLASFNPCIIDTISEKLLIHEQSVTMLSPGLTGHAPLLSQGSTMYSNDSLVFL